MAIKNPQLLDADYAIAAIILPIKVSISFNVQSVSTATMVLPDRTAAIKMHDFVRLFNQNGEAGIYRYTGENETLAKERQISLKHAIDTLEDDHFGSEKSYTGTVAGWIAEILANQHKAYWQLGECEDTNEFIRPNVSYDKLSDLFWEVISQEHDYYPTFDFSTVPFTVHIRRLPATIGAELRLRRNILNGIRITRNDKEMCNMLRLRVTTQNDEEETSIEKIYQDEASQAEYGVIQKRETVFADDVSDVDAWAARYLAERNHPSISISVPALDLYSQTGEQWDEFSVGKLARVALPDYGETYVERVSSVVYPDVYGQPRMITVNLATPPKSLSDAVRETAKTASRSAGGLSITNKELTYWEMRVTKIKLAQDATGITELYTTGIELDAETGAKIYSIKQGFEAQRAEIIANSNAISLRVAKNEVISAINLTSESATIQAKRINLSGYVTASELNARFTTLQEAWAGNFTTVKLDATNADIMMLNLEQLIFANSTVKKYSISMGSAVTSKMFLGTGSALDLNHKHTATVNSDGTVTIGGAIAI